MGTPDLLGGYGTFSFFTSDPAAATDRSLLRRRRIPRRRDGRRGARGSRGARQPVPERAREGDRGICRLRGRVAEIREARDRGRDAAPGGGGVERLGAGALLARRRPVAAGRVPVLCATARPVVPALCKPAQHGPGGAGDADLVARGIRDGARPRLRPVLQPGMPEETKALKTGLLTPRSFWPRPALPGPRWSSSTTTCSTASSAGCSSTTSATSIRSHT
jgi:hypothetical protein